jgi:DNA-binding transcriptional LysR family regulator
VVYAPNRYLNHRVRVFIDWLVELFAQMKTTTAFE